MKGVLCVLAVALAVFVPAVASATDCGSQLQIVEQVVQPVLQPLELLQFVSTPVHQQIVQQVIVPQKVVRVQQVQRVQRVQVQKVQKVVVQRQRRQPLVQLNVNRRRTGLGIF